jgi:hypothetical protein
MLRPARDVQHSEAQMRWMIVIFLLVLLLIIDQSWYRGHYTGQVSRAVNSFFHQTGLTGR